MAGTLPRAGCALFLARASGRSSVGGWSSDAGACGQSGDEGYDDDQLAISGLAALVWHPVYSAWIVFILPGLVLLTRSWPLLFTPFVAYAVFKLRIHCEDEYLERRIGQAYLEYRARVNELFPSSATCVSGGPDVPRCPKHKSARPSVISITESV